MAKKDVSDELKSLRAKVTERKVLIGTERVLKALRAGNSLSCVYLSSNCPDKTRRDIEHYANLVGARVSVLGQSNEELGIFCKKNFFVSVLAVLGE